MKTATQAMVMELLTKLASGVRVSHLNEGRTYWLMLNSVVLVRGFERWINAGRPELTPDSRPPSEPYSNYRGPDATWREMVARLISSHDGVQPGRLDHTNTQAAISAPRATARGFEHWINANAPLAGDRTLDLDRVGLPWGWEVIPEEQVSSRLTRVEPMDVSRIALEHNVSGRPTFREFKRRLEEIHAPVLGARSLKHAFAHQGTIPEHWREKRVYFWGTILTGPREQNLVRFIYWDSQERQFSSRSSFLHDRVPAYAWVAMPTV